MFPSMHKIHCRLIPPPVTSTLRLAIRAQAFRTRAEIANSTLIAVDDLMELLPTLGEPLLKNDVRHVTIPISSVFSPRTPQRCRK